MLMLLFTVLHTFCKQTEFLNSSGKRSKRIASINALNYLRCEADSMYRLDILPKT